LIHLINDILDMEKVTAGKMQFDYTVVNLVTVVQHALESNRGYGDQLSVHFKFTGEADNEVMVRVDEKRMAQVMSNLLSNAAKYSPKDDSVEISVIASEKTVRISVHDNGKGIPDEFKSRIFSKFAQADSSDTRQKGGTGLGLNITKAIVEQQGGGIGFESGEGIGTTFYVDLPIWSEKKPEQKEALKEPDPDKLLVLIVEDDHDVSKLLSLMLDKEGYQFHQAFDYQSALQHIEKHEYDAITLDLMIPGGSGLSLLRQLRANKATSHLPVIVISAKASEGKLEVEGDSLEVMDWIEKPVDEKRLLESLRSGFTHSMTTGVRILHVEDDSDVAQIIDSLTGAEYQITHATTLAQAKQMVSSETFDLVLLDIGLPDGSGLDLLPILHTHERQTPVIIFSAMDVSEEIIAQVDSILIKFKTDNNRLMQQIKSAISKKSKTRKGE
jgi:DNA-binding response OmpR family regulator